MITYLQNIVPLLRNFSESLDKTSILINKPWALIDEQNEVQKLIFKKDKELILSKNGQVQIGKWDYFPEAKSLLIDRGTDKILCNEAFINQAVLIMKLDGTNNQFFILANENILPDLNVRDYLLRLRRKRLNLHVTELCDGRNIEIQPNISGWSGVGSLVSIDAMPIKDGKYMLALGNQYLDIKKSHILKVLTETKHVNPIGQEIFIQQHDSDKIKRGDFVYIPEEQLDSLTLDFSRTKNLIVRNGKFVRFERKNSLTRFFSKVWKKLWGIYEK